MTGFLTSRTARHIGRFKVQERVYTTRSDGSRVLKHAKGKEISFAQAIAEGLVDPNHVPAEAIQAILPRDVYENGRLVGRAGKVVSLADLERFGFVTSNDHEEVDEMVDDDSKDDKSGASDSPVRTTDSPKKVRTTKVPAPEV